MAMRLNQRELTRLRAAALRHIETRIAPGVASRARGYAPNDSGDLRDSIRVARNNRDVQVGTDLPYGHIIEHGTSTQPAQPFLRPALKSAR